MRLCPFLGIGNASSSAPTRCCNPCRAHLRGYRFGGKLTVGFGRRGRMREAGNIYARARPQMLFLTSGYYLPIMVMIFILMVF